MHACRRPRPHPRDGGKGTATGGVGPAIVSSRLRQKTSRTVLGVFDVAALHQRVQLWGINSMLQRQSKRTLVQTSTHRHDRLHCHECRGDLRVKDSRGRGCSARCDRATIGQRAHADVDPVRRCVPRGSPGPAAVRSLERADGDAAGRASHPLDEWLGRLGTSVALAAETVG